MCYLFIEVTDMLPGVTYGADGALYIRIVARLESILVDTCHGARLRSIPSHRSATTGCLVHAKTAINTRPWAIEDDEC